MRIPYVWIVDGVIDYLMFTGQWTVFQIDVANHMGPSWSWSYGSWLYIYICHQCLSPLALWVRIQPMRRCSRYTVEPVWSDTWVFRHPVTSDKNFRSQNISLTFFVKKPWVFRHLSLPTSDTVLQSQCY